VSQHPRTESIDNACNNTGDSEDYGIRKATSYPSFCANKYYLARYQLCMVELNQIDGELEDLSNEEK
jgi:hypothetical protein